MSNVEKYSNIQCSFEIFTTRSSINDAEYYECDICGVDREESELHILPACADSVYGDNLCCYVFICDKSCVFVCSKCNLKIESPNDILLLNESNTLCSERIFECRYCFERDDGKRETYSLFPWWGISSEEWLKRHKPKILNSIDQ